MNSPRTRRQLPYKIEIETQIGDIVFAVDRSGRVVFWNEEAERVFGFGYDEVVGKAFHSLGCSTEAGAGIDIAPILDGHDLAAGVRCPNKTGHEMELYLYATVGKDESGAVAGVVFVGRDVTDFWRAEEAMLMSEEKYRLLFEGSSDSVVVADPDGRLLDVNEASARMLGYPVAELKRMKLRDVVPADRMAVAEQAFAKLLQRGRLVATLEFARKDGRRIQVDVSATVVTVGGERRIISISRDVTGRVLAADEMKASERMYRRMFDTAPDGVLLEELGGRIIGVNKRACELLGYSEAELCAMKVDDLVPEATREWLPAVRGTIMAAGRFHGEVVNIRKDGTPIDIELVASVLDLQAEKTLVISYIRDISERKRSEALLRDSEERYRVVFETTGLATIIIEEDTTVSLVNNEFLRLFGYGIDEVVGKSWTTYVHPDDIARMKEYHWLRRVEGAVAPRNYEFRLIDKQGQVRDCYLTVDMIPGTRRSVTSIQDITERKRTERELVESRLRYRDMFYGVPIGIYQTRPDGTIIMANSALTAMLGYSSYKEFLKRNLEQEGYEPSYPRREFKERMERNGEVRGLEAAWIRRDGTTVYVRENARAVRDEQGNVLYYQGSVEDITDRKLLERRLLEQEENFRALADNAGDGIMIADVGADGPNLYVNRRATELFGLTPEELQRKSVRELASPESQALIDEYTRRRAAGEPAPDRYDIEVVRSDGARRPVETTVAETTWRGRPAVIINLRDVSERRVMTDRLTQSESRYRSLLESIQDGLTAVDAAGRFTFVNDTVLRRSGRPLEWWLGRHHGDVVAPEHRAMAEQRVAATMRGEQVPPYEMEYQASDGRVVHIEMHTAPLREGERIVGVLGISRDISDRKRAEKELHEKSEQFRRMVELSPDGVAVHQDGRVVMVNPAGASVLGYSGPAEIVGKPIMDLVAPEDRQLVAARVRRVMEEGRPGNMVEERFVRKDGSLVNVEVINAPFIWRGRPAVQVAVRDITERRRLARLADETTTELHAILENSPEGVIAESDGIIAYANVQFAVMFGYDSPEQVVGLPATVLDAPEDRERLAGYTQQRLRGEPAPGCYRFKGLRRDGRPVEMAASISAYKYEGRDFILAFVRELPSDRC